MTVLFMYNFRSESNKCPTIFSKFIFSHFTPEVRLFFAEKRKPKIFGFKNVMERGVRKCRENSTQGLEISKRLMFPQDDRTDTKFTVPFRMLFQRSKSILDRLKRVFSAFRRKPSLGAPETTMVVMVVIIIIIQGDQDDHIQTPLMACEAGRSGQLIRLQQFV